MPNDPRLFPRFSIVTCTWNSAATLGDTLASLRMQTCRDFEHIFVDGGSVDATLDMIDACPGNKRVLHGVGGGISRAMNAGIEAASGAIVAHLHADDYYAAPDVLAQVARRFDETGAAWVVGNIQVLRDGQLAPPLAMRPFSYRAYAAGQATIAHPAVFVRRAWFARVGAFDTSLRYAMDIDLWLRLAAVAPPALLGPYADGVPRASRQRVLGQQDQGTPGRVRRAAASFPPCAAGLCRVLPALPEADAGTARVRRRVSTAVGTAPALVWPSGTTSL